MSKRDDLIAKFADDIKNKIGERPDMDLLTKVTIGYGPSIYNQDSAVVSATSEDEQETVRKNFLIKKLGLAYGPKLMEAIHSVMDKYGKSNRNKYRPVVYYLLAKHYKKESVLRVKRVPYY